MQIKRVKRIIWLLSASLVLQMPVTTFANVEKDSIQIEEAREEEQTSQIEESTEEEQPPQTEDVPKEEQPSQTEKPPKEEQPSQTEEPPKEEQPSQTEKPSEEGQPPQTEKPSEEGQPPHIEDVPKEEQPIQTNGFSGGVSGDNGASAGGNQSGGTSKENLKREVEKAQRMVAKKEQEIENLKALLENNTLYAKKGGIVTKISIEEGDEITPGKTIVVIGNTGKKKVCVQVSQNDIGKVSEGQMTELFFPAWSEETITGKVLSKKYKAGKDEATGETVFDVEIELEETEAELMEGMTCSVHFIQKKIENVLRLSNKAIQIENGQQFVMVKREDGSIERKNITCGFSDGSTTEIVDGLEEGEVVVIEG